VLLVGGSAGEAALAVLWLLPLALAALAILVFLGWLVGRTTLYTITNRRVVMRIGIVLDVTFNIPFRVIESAGLRKYEDGTGDIALALAGPDRIAYLHLWPHARPWRIARAEPTLRTVPDAAAVSALLMSAISAVEGPSLRAGAQPLVTPALAANDASPWVAAR
jgi:hypothetical protein